jgi:hypothetical protein
MTQALLALEDGTTFWGKAFGASGETFGEVVFNTNLTGRAIGGRNIPWRNGSLSTASLAFRASTPGP